MSHDPKQPPQVNRRDTLHWIGAAGIAGIIGCGSDGETASTASTGGAGKGAGGAGGVGTTGSGGAPRGVGGDPGAGGSAGGVDSGAVDALSNGTDAATVSDATIVSDARVVTDAGEPITCVVRPEQTEGPYFVDENLVRADIRPDPTNGSMSAGAPLLLALGIYRVDGAQCAPLANALVDVWQCDAKGIYSDVLDQGGLFDSRGKKFLRGSLRTNEAGVAEFVTIYPGWYSGRTVHIHFKIRVDPTSAKGHVFTSQLYFADAFTDEVYAEAPYNTRGARSTRNAQDGIFNQGGANLMLDVHRDGPGYATRFNLGLAI